MHLSEIDLPQLIAFIVNFGLLLAVVGLILGLAIYVKRRGQTKVCPKCGHKINK